MFVPTLRGGGVPADDAFYREKLTRRGVLSPTEVSPNRDNFLQLSKSVVGKNVLDYVDGLVWHDMYFVDKLINWLEGIASAFGSNSSLFGLLGGSWTLLYFPLVPVLFSPAHPSFSNLFSSFRLFPLRLCRRVRAGILFRRILWWRNLAPGESGWRSAAAERSVNSEEIFP